VKIGVRAESFKKTIRENITMAAGIGLDGVQLDALGSCGDKNLWLYSDGELADLLGFIQTHGMEISAVCGDLGGAAFQLAHQWPARFAALRQVGEACRRLGVHVMTSHIGCIPDCPADPLYPVMVRNVREIAGYLAPMGITMAIETGPELADVLLTFIETVDSPGLGVNLDPANLRGVSCEDPVYAVQQLAPYIVHTHAKDALNLYVGSAAKFYEMPNPDGSRRNISARAAGFQEVPLGTGMVPWDAYLAELKKTGFDGYLTIERECGDNPSADIQLAKDFLLKRIGG